MNRTAVAAGAAALALLGVFVALAASVVDARKPLAGEVSRSFDAAIAKRAEKPGAVRPLGCTKLRVSVFRCSALLRPRSAPESTVSWKLWLRGDGCWYLIAQPPYPTQSTLVLANVDLAKVTGCATD